MINLRNWGEFPIVMKIKGTLTTTATNVQSYDFSQLIPFNATINAVWAYEGTPGSSAAGTPGDCIDLQYVATATTSTAVAATLVSSGVMFNFASSTVSSTVNSGGYGIIPVTSTATATAGGYGTGNIITSSTQFNPPQVARGGYFKIVVKTVATTPGADLNVIVSLNRARQGGNIDPVQIATYNNDSDIF
jgi:hypothetical protein